MIPAWMIGSLSGRWTSSRDPNDGTVEVDPRYLETVTYHNREFQEFAIENRIYFAPIDEVKSTADPTRRVWPTVWVIANLTQDEVERLILQHRLFSIVFDRRLVFPPLNNPRRILECGHGTASWAVEVADLYPRCEVCVVLLHQPLSWDRHSERIAAHVRRNSHRMRIRIVFHV